MCHHSHLGCIWPFDSLPEEPSPELLSVVENSIAHWISMGIGKWSEWCIPWANIIYTRMELNEAPMQLFTLWREIFVNEGLATVYLPRMLSLIAHRRHDIAAPREQNEVMQLDGCGGFLDAFTQMCAYARGGKLRLFRGMPEKWRDVRIDGLRLPGVRDWIVLAWANGNNFAINKLTRAIKFRNIDTASGPTSYWRGSDAEHSFQVGVLREVRVAPAQGGVVPA